MMALRDLAYAISPPWLQGDIGSRYIHSMTVLTDVQCERVRQGTLAKMPQRCDPSFLPYIGRDRTVVRGFAESDTHFALRCKTAPYDWHFAGLPGGLLGQVLGYLSPAAPMARAVWSAHALSPFTGQPTQWEWIPDGAATGTSVSSWATLGSSPYFGEWFWDRLDNRRRMWLVLYANATGAPWVGDCGVYGDGSSYGDGESYGTTIVTAAQIEDIRRIIKAWKGSHARCEWIVIALDALLFDPFHTGDLPGDNSTLPDGNWAGYGKDVAGDYVHARFEGARYMPGSSS